MEAKLENDMSRLIPAIALGSVVALSGAAGASAAELSQLCAVKDPAAAKVSEQQVRQTLTEHGYTNVRGIGAEDGCIEAKGTDKDGKRFEVYLHPATGEIVKTR